MNVALIGIVIVVAGLVLWLVVQTSQEKKKKALLEGQLNELRRDLQTMAMAQAQSSGQIATIGQSVSQRLESVTKALQDGVSNSAQIATQGQTAIANELKGTGVTVTCLCPGPTSTEFQERAKITGIRLTKFGTMDARTVAEDGYRALMAGKPVVISGFKNWLVAQSVRFAPRRMATAMARKLQESKSE